MHKENVLTIKYNNNNAGEVLNLSIKDLKIENQSCEEYSDRAPFKDTINLQTQELSIKQFLPWPIDISLKHSIKWRKSTLKIKLKRLEKEREKFLKNEKRMKEVEEETKVKEEMLLKKKEETNIKK